MSEDVEIAVMIFLNVFFYLTIVHKVTVAVVNIANITLE
jgi:hypothetical protein